MLVDICMKFHDASLRGFQVTEQTRFVTDRQTDRRTDRQTDRRPGKNNMFPNPEGIDKLDSAVAKHLLATTGAWV